MKDDFPQDVEGPSVQVVKDDYQDAKFSCSMKKFVSEAEFWAGGAGAFIWGNNEKDGKILNLMLPHKHKDGGEFVQLYMMHADDVWSKPGNVNGWDGNEEKPTLLNSVRSPYGWHGYVYKGDLYTLEDDEEDA